jgi:ketosteroid isomerase-like protein
MSTDPIAVVRSAYAALAARDGAAMVAVTSAEIVIEQSDAVPWGGRYVGAASSAAFHAAVAAHLDSKVETHDLSRAGDQVVQVGRTRGTALPTGRPFDAVEVHVWTVAVGLITGLHIYVDTVALGLDPDVAATER